MGLKLIIGRREFTREAVIAALSGVAITVSGCGGGGGSSSPMSPSAPERQGAISSNHGHQAVVTDVQIMAGNAIQLDIRGTADHAHTVTLIAEAVQDIGAGRAVATNSTTTTSPSEGTHIHTITFNASSGEDPIVYPPIGQK